MPRFAQSREVNPFNVRGSLLESGVDYGFGWGGPGWGLESVHTWGTGYGLLPPFFPVGGRRSRRSRTANGSPAVVPPVVIGEIPQTVLPSGIVNPIGTSGPLSIPPRWPTVEIGGEPRERVPDVYRGGRAPVLEPFDPDVVIGEVQGADTAAQEENGQDEEELMAHDWGHLIRGGISEVFGLDQPAQLPGVYNWQAGQPRPPMGTGDVYYNGQGQMRLKCKRRRRRRLLTESDFNDLMRIATLPNKDTVKVALAKAVGRSR